MLGKAEKGIIFLIALILVSVFLVFPGVMGTKTFPIAIIEGNSMYPNLQNGDLVIFRSVSPQSVTNGSIIVFVQGQTGISMLDSLIRPVVVHRVKDIIVQYDGVINFRTKGDNNQDTDPELVRDSQVLGAPIQIVPKVGLLFLFLRSSQGMIAVVGFITLFYLGNYESKIKDDMRKGDFVGKMAQMALNKEISNELFGKLEVAVNYSEDINLDDLKDDSVKSLVQWMRGGGLEENWKIDGVECPICHSTAIRIESDDEFSQIICEGCDVKPEEAEGNSENNLEQPPSLIKSDSEKTNGGVKSKKKIPLT
jgi:signal peptidase I